MSSIIAQSTAHHLTARMGVELRRLEDLLTMPVSVVLEEYGFMFSQKDDPLRAWLSEHEDAMLGVFLYHHVARGDEVELEALASIPCLSGANPVAVLTPLYKHFVA